MGFIAFILYSVILFFIGAIFGLNKQIKIIIESKQIRLNGKYFQLKEIVNDRNEDPDRDSN